MVRFPEGWRVEPLSAGHDRAAFSSGRPEVDDWLRKRARQSQDKHLTSTHVLRDDRGVIAGYYTLAVGIVDFDQLPPEETRKLPHRALPVITLAWLGLRTDLQGRGLGERLLAEALAHCRRVRRDIEFVAVLIDALDAQTRAFYERYDFRPVPGHPFKLFISAGLLEAMARR
jgi:GNAT superfamily N-acetyltransferase